MKLKAWLACGFIAGSISVSNLVFAQDGDFCAVGQAACSVFTAGSDERELCEAAAAYADPRLVTVCGVVIGVAGQGAALGFGSGTECSKKNPANCLAVSIQTAHSDFLGRSVSTCEASSSTASATVINCNGTVLPGTQGVAAGVGVGAGMGSMCATAVFFATNLLPAAVKDIAPPETLSVCATATRTLGR